MKKEFLQKLVKEEIKKLLKEYFPDKEDFIFFEQLEKRQKQIYPDAADAGITPDDKDFKYIKEHLSSLVKTYGSKNEKFSHMAGKSEGGTVKLFIPVEVDDYDKNKYDGYTLEVMFVKDTRLKKLYRKQYDSFFSVDIQRKSLTNEDAKKYFGSKA